jgi:hypothetical protein
MPDQMTKAGLLETLHALQAFAQLDLLGPDVEQPVERAVVAGAVCGPDGSWLSDPKGRR